LFLLKNVDTGKKVNKKCIEVKILVLFSKIGIMALVKTCMIIVVQIQICQFGYLSTVSLYF